jgi:hypothetical protein
MATSTVTPKLSAEEIERYAPYHTMPEFSAGLADYVAHRPWPVGRISPNSAGGQAYDRGSECAMRRGQAEIRRLAEIRRGRA